MGHRGGVGEAHKAEIRGWAQEMVGGTEDGGRHRGSWEAQGDWGGTEG